MSSQTAVNLKKACARETQKEYILESFLINVLYLMYFDLKNLVVNSPQVTLAAN